jgi:hypothetical protein
MATIKDFAMSLLVGAVPVGMAAAILLLRDRHTLRPGMSAVERRSTIDRNTAGTVHLVHILALIASLAAVVLSSIRHQNPWYWIAEASIFAFVVFRFYRLRAEESIQPRPSPYRPSQYRPRPPVGR